MRVVVGITGASGAIYGYRIAEELGKASAEVIIVASSIGREMLQLECGVDEMRLAKLGRVYSNSDMMAPMASGSYKFDALVVAPCSMKTLACIANGISSSLIARTADVALKERRWLVLVPRETPLSLVDIRNMEKATEAGAVILPACPGFYHQPKTVDRLVDHVVGKVLDQLGIEHSLFRRWGDRNLELEPEKGED